MVLCYICSSASNRIISAKDHASIQINIAEVCLVLSTGVISCLTDWCNYMLYIPICVLRLWPYDSMLMCVFMFLFTTEHIDSPLRHHCEVLSVKSSSYDMYFNFPLTCLWFMLLSSDMIRNWKHFIVRTWHWHSSGRITVIFCDISFLHFKFILHTCYFTGLLLWRCCGLYSSHENVVWSAGGIYSFIILFAQILLPSRQKS